MARFRNRIMMAMVPCLLCSHLAHAQAPPSPVPPTNHQIAQWAAELDSDLFLERQLAVQQLIQAGAASVPAVLEVVAHGNLETVTSSIYILRQLAESSDPAAEQAARQALEQISRHEVTVAARRASETLRRLAELRAARAQQHLEALGTRFEFYTVTMGRRREFEQLYSAIIGPGWRGDTPDLDELRWLEEVQGVVLVGPQVTDAWLGRLAAVPHLEGIVIWESQVTDNGMAHLATLQNLRHLQLYYNPLTAQSLKQIAEWPRVTSVTAFGEAFTPDLKDQLKAQLPHVEFDLRRGGFLGVGGQADPSGCQITILRTPSAAERAGLEANDIITAYNGHPVKDFLELTDQISQNAAGDHIALDILRLGQTIKLEDVVLGKLQWERP